MSVTHNANNYHILLLELYPGLSHVGNKASQADESAPNKWWENCGLWNMPLAVNYDLGFQFQLANVWTHYKCIFGFCLNHVLAFARDPETHFSAAHILHKKAICLWWLPNTRRL